MKIILLTIVNLRILALCLMMLAETINRLNVIAFGFLQSAELTDRCSSLSRLRGSLSRRRFPLGPEKLRLIAMSIQSRGLKSAAKRCYDVVSHLRNRGLMSINLGLQRMTSSSAPRRYDFANLKSTNRCCSSW